MASNPAPPITGRCYCGDVTFEIAANPLTVAYCHCADCRRWTGAPLPAFAAFVEDAAPDFGEGFSVVEGVTRWICSRCGSPLAARFDYLPGQIYMPLGVLDQAADLAPRLHCHDGSRMPWLHLDDGLPRSDGSGRAALNDAAG